VGDLQGYVFSPNLGDTAGALKSYQASAGLLAPLHRAHPKDAEAQRFWLETEGRLAILLEETGDNAGAITLLRNSMPTAKALIKVPGAEADAQQILGEFYQYLADAEGAHDLEEALADARRYLEIFTRLAERYPDRSDFVLEQSSGYCQVGRILTRQGDPLGSLENYLHCVSLREGLVKAHPNDVVYKRNLMMGYGHVADTLGSHVVFSLGDSTGARAYYRKTVAIADEIYKEDPNDATAKFDLAVSLQRLGMMDVPASGTVESLAVLQQSATMLSSIVANDPKGLAHKKQLALTLEYVGHRLASLGSYHEAIRNYQRSMAMADDFLAADPSDRSAMSQAVASGRGLATAIALTGNRGAALRQAQATIKRAEESVGIDKRGGQRRVAEATMELGSIYEILAKHSRGSQGKRDWEAARSALVRSVSLLEATASENKLVSIERADLQNARELLAEADQHLSTAEPAGP